MSALSSYPIIAVILFIGILIFVHELGHFLVGRFYGIGVEVFSIGVGPTLFSFRRGGTEFQVCLLPLGGYVKFAGVLPSEEVAPEFHGSEFYRSSRKARTFTLLAGPGANVLLAAVIFTVHGLVGVERVPALIGGVRADSPAAIAGIEPGDQVTRIGDKDIKTWREMQEVVRKSAGKALSLEILRAGKKLNLGITPAAAQGKDDYGNPETQGRLGISFGVEPAVLTVEEDSPAFQAGLRTGDRVLAVSGQDVDSWHSLTGHLSTDSVKVTVQRYKTEDKEETLELPSFVGVSASLLTIGADSGELRFGDKLLTLAGREVGDVFTVAEILEKQEQAEVKMEVLRMGKRELLNVSLKAIEVQEPGGKKTYYRLPVEFLGRAEFPPLQVERYPHIHAVVYGLKTAGINSWKIVQAIVGLIVGSLPLKALGGPMAVAKVAGDAAEAGWLAFFLTLAMLSINIGILNMFPIPALDGGKLLILAWEAVSGRDLSENALDNVHRLGFVMLMSLVILATYNDLSRFWGSMLRAFQGGE